MDDSKRISHRTHPPLPGSPQPAALAVGTGDSFVPLRLVLRPGGLSVDLTRPEGLIGRHPGADLRLRLPGGRRRPCRIVFTDGNWQIFDLNSLNGLYVNSQKVARATLHHLDMVRVGSYLFEVHLGPCIAGVVPPPALEEDVAPPRRQAS